jgi:hypothetical protein
MMFLYQNPHIPMRLIDNFCRFLFIPERDLTPADSFEISLSNLVATVAISHERSRSWSRAKAEQIFLELHKPVTTVTLFRIIESTSMRHLASYRKASKPTVAGNGDGPSALSQSGMKFGPVRELSSIFVHSGAFLLAGSAINSSWVTNTRLVKAECSVMTRWQNDQWDEQSLTTIFEFLKLAGRQCDPAGLREYDEASDGTYHISLKMSRQQYDIFRKKVSSSDIT